VVTTAGVVSIEVVEVSSLIGIVVFTTVVVVSMFGIVVFTTVVDSSMFGIVVDSPGVIVLRERFGLHLPLIIYI
jgi:hypothetical protein